jgi:hypothetical protein
MVLFVPYAMADFMFPPSTILSLVLETSGLQLTHLTANSIFPLSVFVYWCEQFVYLPPCLLLFRHFFRLRRTGRNTPVGGYYF